MTDVMKCHTVMNTRPENTSEVLLSELLMVRPRVLNLCDNDSLVPASSTDETEERLHA